VLAKLMYVSPACRWGFATTANRQLVASKSVQVFGLYGDGDPPPTQLAEDANESLLKRIMWNKHHLDSITSSLPGLLQAFSHAIFRICGVLRGPSASATLGVYLSLHVRTNKPFRVKG